MYFQYETIKVIQSDRLKRAIVTIVDNSNFINCIYQETLGNIKLKKSHV